MTGPCKAVSLHETPAMHRSQGDTAKLGNAKPLRVWNVSSITAGSQ